ncbi:MAG: chemotaxis protein CheX [Pirellulaceae bacterium]|nr:chemotaxis protein CheX [Pirellulaceae bacterium]
MNDQQLQIIVDAAKTVFATALGVETTQTQLIRCDDAHPLGSYSGVIAFSGAVNGQVVLSFEAALAHKFAELMLDQEQADPAEVTDTICELTNMVFGMAKARLPAEGIAMSLPSKVVGKSHALPFSDGCTVIGVCLETQYGAGFLQLGLESDVPPLTNTVLVVDDDPLILELMRRALCEQFDVTTAGNGDEALALVQQHPFAAIVSDFKMAPGMNGVEFLLRAAKIRPRCARLLVTSYKGESHVTLAHEHHIVTDVLTKPFDTSMLCSHVVAAVSLL